MKNLLAAALLCVSAASPINAEQGDLPAMGRQTDGVAHLDEAMLAFMKSIDCQSATIAVAGDGKFFHARSYGYSDQARQTPTPLTTTMRIASCTKPITNAAIKNLIRDGKIKADTPAFAYLGIKPFSGKLGDERIGEITIKQLLKHEGGFDRGKSGDPLFITGKIRRAMGLRQNPTIEQMIAYQISRPLDFAPGEKSVYSNFGYVVLGQIIAKASGQSYIDYLNTAIAKPSGMNDLHLSQASSAKRPANEVWYPIPDNQFAMETVSAAGGLATSTPSLLAFMRHYWISGEPRKTRGGQHWIFFGSLPGTTAYIEQRLDRIDVAVLLNNRRDSSFSKDNDRLRREINAAIDKMKAGD